MILVLVFFTQSLFAQEKLSPSRISRPEIIWAITHPFAALKAFKLTKRSLGVSESMRRDSVLDGVWIGGQLDAFRHAYWMALLAQKINPKKVIRLGNAHEKANRIDFKKGRLEETAIPDSVNTEMDYFNNIRGVEIGCANKNASPEELKQIVIKSILEGNMKIIRMDEQGNFLDCENNIISMDKWNGKWNIPKCLVPSNQTHKREPRK